MDINRIILALKATMDPEGRAQAEEYLLGCRKIIGFTPALMKIVVSEELDGSVRQAAVLYVKNMISCFWGEQPQEVHGDSKAAVFTIHEQDRYLLRESIIPAIIQSPEVIRVQLAQCVRMMLEQDFPGRWPEAVSKIIECLNSVGGEQLYAGLLLLLQLVKNYEYKKVKDQEPLVGPMKGILPMLYQRIVQLIPNNSQESMVLQKLIIKCLYALVQHNMHPDLMTPNHFADWMSLMCQVVEAPLPEEMNQIDEEDRPEQVWYKTKKWAARLMDSAFDRFANPNGAGPEYAGFVEVYGKRIAEPTVRTMLNILQLYQSQKYVTPFLLHRAVTLLDRAVAVASTWKMLKDNVIGIITTVIFPLLCSTKEDDELWSEDVQEYIRTKYDVMMDLIDPDSAAASFIWTCIKKRKMLNDIMTIIQHVFSQSTATPFEVDGALHIFGLIANSLLKKAAYSQAVSDVMVNQVIPRMSDASRILRARACWCVKEYSRYKFGHSFVLGTATATLIKCLLHDPEIPVKFEAALALEMLLYEHDEVKTAVLPHLRPVVLEVLDLLRQTSNDELNTAMSSLIASFEEEIVPIAVDVTRELCDIFVRMTSQEDFDEDHNVTAMGVLGTIQALLDAAEERQEVIKQLELLVLALVRTIFERNLSDHIDQAFALICSLNYAQVSDVLWEFYPTVCAAFQNCSGQEYFDEIMPVLYNYVVVGSNRFLDDPSRIQMMLSMCSEVFNGKGLEDCHCYAAKLLEVLLLEYRDRIDNYVQTIVELVIARLGKEVFSAELRALCMGVLIAALLYNAKFTMQLLQSLRSSDGTETLLDNFVKHWMNDVHSFTGIHNRKLCLLGLCTLINFPERPAIVNQMCQSFLPCCITLFDGLEKAYQSRAEGENSSEEESEISESSDSGASFVYESDKCTDSRMEDTVVTENDSFRDEEDSTDEDDETLDYEEYATFIDREETGWDEYVVFKDTLAAIQQSEPQWHMALVSALTDEQKKQLEKVAVTAEQKRQQIATRQQTAVTNAFS